MRNLLFDTLGLAGFASLTGGLYLRFGLADALMASGSLLLVLALVLGYVRVGVSGYGGGTGYWL